MDGRRRDVSGRERQFVGSGATLLGGEDVLHMASRPCIVPGLRRILRCLPEGWGDSEPLDKCLPRRLFFSSALGFRSIAQIGTEFKSIALALDMVYPTFNVVRGGQQIGASRAQSLIHGRARALFFRHSAARALMR